MKAEEDPLLNPGTEAARIRAFFVHPNWARRGIASRLLHACMDAAHAVGFSRLELMATLPGVPLYQASGFATVEKRDAVLPDGVSIAFVRMARKADGGLRRGRSPNSTSMQAFIGYHVACIVTILRLRMGGRGPYGGFYCC